MPNPVAHASAQDDGDDVFDVTFTVSGTNRFVKATGALRTNTGNETFSTVVWGAGTLDESLAEISEIFNSQIVTAWYELVNPSLGTALPVRFTMSAAPPFATFGSVNLYDDVDQTTPRGALFTATGTDGEPEVDVTDSATGQLVIDGWGARFNTGQTMVATSPQAERTNLVSNRTYSGTSDVAGAPTSVVMEWTGASSFFWVQMAASLNPAVATPPIFKRRQAPHFVDETRWRD